MKDILIDSNRKPSYILTMNKTFNVLYNPREHGGKPNTENKTFHYQVETPEEGFTNKEESNDFAGFRAKIVGTEEYRSFRFDRIVSFSLGGFHQTVDLPEEEGECCGSGQCGG